MHFDILIWKLYIQIVIDRWLWKLPVFKDVELNTYNKYCEFLISKKRSGVKLQKVLRG